MPDTKPLADMTDAELQAGMNRLDLQTMEAASANGWDYSHPDVAALVTERERLQAEFSRRYDLSVGAAQRERQAAKAEAAAEKRQKRRNAATGRKYTPDAEDKEAVLREALAGWHRATAEGKEGKFFGIFLGNRTRKQQQAIRELADEGFLIKVGRGGDSMMGGRAAERYGGATYTITEAGEARLREILDAKGEPYPEGPDALTLATAAAGKPREPAQEATRARLAPDQVSREHQAQREALAASTARLAAKVWAEVDVHNLADSWVRLVHRVAALVAAGQLAAARQADPYLADLMLEAQPQGQVVPESLAGVASDGRDLADLLMAPVWSALSALARGASLAVSLASGAALLDLLSRTMVADAGRAADLVAMAANPAVTSYVRVVELPACARCIILAGREYGLSEGFQRHPRCDCSMAPVTKNYRPEITDARDHFDAMSEAQRRKVFGEAGVKAIEAGSDPAQVVNARRGMATATRYGRKVQVTNVGQTKRGLTKARRGRGRTRLMPEEIFRMAGGNRDKAIDLLKRHGYIL